MANPLSNQSALHWTTPSLGQKFELKKAEDYVPPKPETKVQKTASLRPRQIWQGIVSCRLEDSFFALLSDRTHKELPDEEAEFSIDEVSDDQKNLVQEGAVFYWVIGSEKSPAGVIRNVYMFEFQRTPKWTASALRSARQRAEEFDSIFD